MHHTEPVLQCSFWYPGNADMALTDPWSGEDDDTGYHYDTPSGNIWRRAPRPGGRRFPGREAAAGERPAGSRRFSFLP